MTNLFDSAGTGTAVETTTSTNDLLESNPYDASVNKSVETKDTSQRLTTNNEDTKETNEDMFADIESDASKDDDDDDDDVTQDNKEPSFLR